MSTPKTLTIEIPFYDGSHLEIDLSVSVTYQPRLGCSFYFSAKQGCWYPGEDPELEIISIDYIPGSKLDDMSLWAGIQAKVRENLIEDDTQLWEHFCDVLNENADRRDQAQQEKTVEHSQ